MRWFCAPVKAHDSYKRFCKCLQDRALGVEIKDRKGDRNPRSTLGVRRGAWIFCSVAYGPSLGPSKEGEGRVAGSAQKCQHLIASGHTRFKKKCMKHQNINMFYLLKAQIL